MANRDNENDYRNRQDTREADKAGHEGGYNGDMGDDSSMDLDLGDDNSDTIDTVEERE